MYPLPLHPIRGRLTGRFLPAVLCSVIFCISIVAGSVARAGSEDPTISYNFENKKTIRNTIEQARRLSLMGFHDSSMQLYKHALEQSILIHYKYGIARSMTSLGNAEVNLSQTSKAMDFFKGALNYCDTTDETRGLIAIIYNNIANIYFLWGDNQQAAVMLMKAMSFRNRFKSEGTFNALYINLANILKVLGKVDLALEYLDKAEALAIQNNDFVSLSNAYHGKGTIYIDLQEWERAKDYMLKSIETGVSNQYDDIIYSATINLGTIALAQDQPEEAIRLVTEVNSRFTDASPYYYIGSLHCLSRAYSALGQPELAEDKLKEALAGSYSFNSIRNVFETHQLMHQLYSRNGQYKKAYEHLHEEKRIADSLNNEKNATALLQIESRYQSVKKDKELSDNLLLISRQENQIQIRNIWIGIAVAGLIIATIIIFLLKRNYKHRDALEKERLEHLLRRQTLKEMEATIDTEERIRSRIARDLHDGIMIQFSTVKMNLSSLMGGDEDVLDKKSLQPYILQLDKATQSLRKAAHNLMPDMLLEEGLAEAVYYFLNNLKQEVPFTITYEQLDTIPRFSIQFELALYRIIQELVQNTIKHARATEVFVQLSYSNQQLGIDVEDNGIGMPEAELRNSRGSGLKSIESRMDTLNGNMRIQSGRKGTGIYLEFNMETASGHPA